MIRVSTMGLLTVAALAAGLAAPAHATSDPRLVTSPARARAAVVTRLSVIPSAGRAEIVIAMDSEVDVTDFVLKSPSRIVLDLAGATLGGAPMLYDKVARGGVTDVRYAQYRSDVVRVVVQLNSAYKYTVTREDGVVRVTVQSGGGQFAAWHAGAAAPSAEPAVVARSMSGETVMGASARAARDPMSTYAREAATPPRAATVVAAAQQQPQPRITVTYQDADIRDVLAAFAAFSGRTIVVGKDVQGTISAEIRDQPWDVALRAILAANGLDANEDQYGIITVDSYQNIAAKQASEPLVRQIVAVNNVSAASLVTGAQAQLSADCVGSAQGGAGNQQQGGAAGGAGSAGCRVRGSVTADSATNTLTIVEVASRLEDLTSYIRFLDQRSSQVALKMRLISIQRSQAEALGVAYDFGSPGTFFNTLLPRVDPVTGTQVSGESRVTLGGESFAGVANAGRSFRGNAALSLIFNTTVGNFSITAFLDALERSTLSDVQAEPTIVTLNNRRAEILVGQETPIRVLDASGAGGGGGGGARANVQFKETGIILGVTPRVNPNSRDISLEIHAEQSSIVTVNLPDLPFYFDKRRADSQILVADGETAVIGGLTQTTIVKNRVGIPILGSLPLIGFLFSQSDTLERKEDLLILITPHIVDEGDSARTQRPPTPGPR